MNLFRRIFPGAATFLAVIHVEDYPQALRNAKIAQNGGADGIFLINHGVPSSVLLDCYEGIKRQMPDFWIGLNCLDRGMAALDIIPASTAGLWVDYAGIDESSKPTRGAEQFAERRKRSRWGGILFGGVAFKYVTPEIKDPAEAARRALPFIDIITTSGAGTGHAPDPAKIKSMRSAIGDHPLAIASGMTPKNVGEFLTSADCFLVATGISDPDSDSELNPALVRQFAEAIKL